MTVVTLGRDLDHIARSWSAVFRTNQRLHLVISNHNQVYLAAQTNDCQFRIIDPKEVKVVFLPGPPKPLHPCALILGSVQY